MLRREKGFTLIELLIVIAIIGILAAIAIPMYRTQTIKARLTEVTNAMSNVASAVAAYRMETEGTANWPECDSISDIQNSLGVSLGALTRLTSMAVDQGTGAITAVIQNIDGAVDGFNLVLTPTEFDAANGDRSISWAWTGSVPPSFIPRK